MTDMKYTLQQRQQRARQLQSEGYNCSQRVVMVFDDLYDVSPESLAVLSAGFGGGIGGQGEVCGAVSGMVMLSGLLRWTVPADKPALYSYIKHLSGNFTLANGSLICRELKQMHHKTCPELIDSAIEIMHNALTKAHE